VGARRADRCCDDFCDYYSCGMTSAPTPQVRAALDAIPVYKPGLAPAPREGVETYKLSSNENPYPPLPGVLEVANRAAETMNRYPDMGVSALTAALSQRLDVPAEHLAVTSGSVAALYYLLQAVVEPGDEVVYAWRSFEAYPIATGVTGGAALQIPLAAGARHDLDAMADAITERTRALLVCTPNNPTGPIVTEEELHIFIKRVPSDVLVVIDEAYREFVRDERMADGVALYRDSPNVCVLRTFSKAYGLAGFRVGYLVAPEPIATAARKCSLPFGVSQVAQDAAIASLEAEPELLARVDEVVSERTRVRAGLAASGWEIPDAQGNFVWLALGDATLEFAATCAKVGLMVRPFAGDGVRVTIGEPAANDAFLQVAGDWRATHS
jgi:histidinol-phosphate aminotransferase